MATYSDLVTLLFCFFVLLYAMSKPDVQKLVAIAASFGQQASLIDWEVGDSIMGSISNGIMDMPPIVDEGKDDEEGDSQSDQSNDDAVISQFLADFMDFDVYSENSAMKNVTVETTEHSIKFNLGDMFFDSGRDDLKPEAIEVLRAIADAYTKTPDYEDYDVFIEGHTDTVPISTGRFPDNWSLSSGRAESVGRFFINECGISPVRITTSGFGEHRPIAGNDTAEGRQRNRRVEIRIVKAVNEADVHDGNN
jgi:chemotaxis protein MotB